MKKKKQHTQPNNPPQISLRDASCQDCSLCETAEFVCLPGEGPIPCDIMVVGEAPGHREDASGKPFVGKSGQKLEELLATIGITRDQVYITNTVRCRPPDNRTPTGKEITSCRKHLQREIEVVKPKYILLLGAVALKGALNKGEVTKRRGEVIEKDGIKYLITFHPAALMRTPHLEPYAKSDFFRLSQLMNDKLDTDKVLNWTLVNTPGKLKQCVMDLAQHGGVLSYDLETSGLYPQDPNTVIRCLGIAREGKQWVIPLNYPGSPFKSYDSQFRVMEMIQKVLENGDREKERIGQNGKFDNKFMKQKFGWSPRMTFDTMLASYLLDENAPHGLKEMSKMYFNASDYELPQPVDPDEVSLEKLCKYCAYDVYYTLKLYPLLRDKLKEDKRLYTIFKELLMPASDGFEKVELRGTYIDPKKFTAAIISSKKRVKEDLAKLNSMVGHPMNWNSTPQVSHLLYNELGLPILERTATGNPSTNSENVLPRLRNKHPIVDQLMTYREHIKLDQFLTSWKNGMINDRIYPGFKLHGTVTGRLSSVDPNFQQVPRDTFIRSLITAPPGWTLVEADLSQAELRIAAMLADDKAMKLAFQTRVDIHQKTASTVMEIPPEEVCKDDRKKAKAVNFGFVYGMGYRKFKDYARDKYGVDLTMQEAEQYRKRFFESYNSLPSWHERSRRLVNKFKQVKSPIGRIRRLPQIDSPDKMLKADAERESINSPVQGFASDIALFAFVRVCRELPEKLVQPIGLVHDAILVYIRNDALDRMVPQIHKFMSDMAEMEETFGCRFTVPIESEVEVGPWGSGTEWKPPEK